MPHGSEDIPSPRRRMLVVGLWAVFVAACAALGALIRKRDHRVTSLSGETAVIEVDQSDSSANDRQYYTFDEYKMYYETTEKVTEHRQSTNRWNYSVAIALLVAIALIFKWSTDRPQNLAAGVTGVACLSILAVLFCVLWLKEIESFKSLNGAKFEVLNDMAPLVRFDSAEARSYEPFLKEWQKLAASKGAKPIKLFGGRLALKSSGPELFFPRAFGVLFVAIAILMIVAAMLGWGQAARPLSPFAPSVAPSVVTTSPSSGLPGTTSSPPASSTVRATP